MTKITKLEVTLQDSQDITQTIGDQIKRFAEVILEFTVEGEVKKSPFWNLSDEVRWIQVSVCDFPQAQEALQTLLDSTSTLKDVNGDEVIPYPTFSRASWKLNTDQPLTYLGDNSFQYNQIVNWNPITQATVRELEVLHADPNYNPTKFTPASYLRKLIRTLEMHWD